MHADPGSIAATYRKFHLFDESAVFDQPETVRSRARV
jgi:hypothetical protein